MPSDIPPPRDDSRLHDDALAGSEIRTQSDVHWNVAEANSDLPISRRFHAMQGDRYADMARHYRRLAARGETLPRF